MQTLRFLFTWKKYGAKMGLSESTTLFNKLSY